MSTPRVIQIIDNLNVGGAETLAVNIANGLAMKGVYSCICITRKEGELKNAIHKEVPYLFLNRKRKFDIKAIRKLLKFIKAHKINVVHAHSSSLYISVIIKICRPKVKLIWHNHYGMNVHNKSALLRYTSCFVSSIVNVSKVLDDWARNSLHARSTVYIPNFGKFNTTDKVTFLKGEKGKRLVHLGGWRYEKDHINLLKAFVMLRKKRSEWTLHLVGKDYGDDYSDTIHRFIKENELQEVVFIYGMCTDIKHILKQASIGVLSSVSEGLPLCLIEFGMSKIPAVTTNVGQCSEVIKTKELVVSNKNSTELAKAIDLLIDDEEYYHRQALVLHEHVSMNFSEEQFMNKLINLYTSV